MPQNHRLTPIAVRIPADMLAAIDDVAACLRLPGDLTIPADPCYRRGRSAAIRLLLTVGLRSLSGRSRKAPKP